MKKLSITAEAEDPQMNPVRTPARATRRRAFTMIELMVVIVIVAILVSLLLPALNSVRVRARIAQVRTEISTLESGIARFKTEFLIEPPSSMVIYENSADWTSNASVPAVVRSRSFLRQLWPQFDFTINRDLNFNGNTTDTFTLAGAECLVFFLGGPARLQDANGNNTRDAGESLIPNGFSKNPADPFSQGGNRLGPFYEFVNDPKRLVESPTNTGFFVYRDPLPNQRAPYVYISSYGGTGYRIEDLGTGGLSYWYLQGTTGTSPAWNATKFQIISPGMDGTYGAGGPFSAGASQPLPPWSLGALTVTAAQRAAEEDNITNFHSGRLMDK